MWQPGWEGSLGENGQVNVWLSPFAVHLKLSQVLISYTPIQIEVKKKKVYLGRIGNLWQNMDCLTVITSFIIIIPSIS